VNAVKGIAALWIAAICLWAGPSAFGAKIRDLCDVQGARSNMLKGIGIVVGLSNSGDKAAAALVAEQRLLERLNVDEPNVKDLKPGNSAIVIVTATLPPFVKEGTRLDVKVDSMYDCQSLENGMLLETHLTGPGNSDTVYVVAQGAVSVGGFAAGAAGSSAKKNHTTSGRVPQGGYVEHEVPASITDGQSLVLCLKRPDFVTANGVQEMVNKKLGSGSAAAFGAGAVRITIPASERDDLVSFIAKVQDVEVETTIPTRIVINERTGTIVVGGNVIIKPCEVAHGNLTLKIAVTPQVTQALPFTNAQPVTTETADVKAEEQEAYLMPLQGTSAGDVAQALNRLHVTPRDMISIFQALKEAGSLEADLEVM
jgi:flagellar P-ring protein precursor FlgI